MKVAVVDDDRDFIKIIEQSLKEQENLDLEVIFYTNAKDYRNTLLEKYFQFDIVIMDIELDHESGIDLAVETNRIFPYCQVIYLTAYNQYMSDVYETDHIYFINKKDMSHYLPLAINKASKIITKRNADVLKVSWKKVINEVKQQDIVFIERNKRITYIFTNKERCLKTSKTIDELYLSLNQDFVRSHESYIINMNYISLINKSEVVLNNGKKISLSRRYVNEIRIAYNQFLTRQN